MQVKNPESSVHATHTSDMMIADGRQFLSLIVNDDSVHSDPLRIFHLWTEGAGIDAQGVRITRLR